MTPMQEMSRIHELREQLLIAKFQRDTFGPGAPFEKEEDDPQNYQNRVVSLQVELEALWERRRTRQQAAGLWRGRTGEADE